MVCNANGLKVKKPPFPYRFPSWLFTFHHIPWPAGQSAKSMASRKRGVEGVLFIRSNSRPLRILLGGVPLKI